MSDRQATSRRLLRLGSRGDDVAELQHRLRELGFDAEGEFGAATRAAVLAFQESRGLLPDGIVGPLTRAELSGRFPLPDEPSPEVPPIDRSLRLPPTQFFGEAQPKSLIVLHHTAGATALSTFRFLASRPAPVAVAYLVARDGTIFELFDPRLWAFHLGVPGSGRGMERRSIGIELANEGALFGFPDNLFAFGGPEEGTRFTGTVFDAGRPWRGHRWFAAYTEAQTEAAIALVDHLLTSFHVPRQTPAEHTGTLRDLTFQGVISHHHVRPDKTDVHPGFPWDRLVVRCGLSLVGALTGRAAA